MRVNIEEMNLHDARAVDEVAALIGRAFSQPPWHGPGTRDSLSISSWREGRAKVFIARKKGKIIGVAAGTPHLPSAEPYEVNQGLGEGKHFYLELLAVDPTEQRRGVAAKLEHARLAYAEQQGYHKVYGQTHPNNTARIKLFERNGFVLLHHARRKVLYVKTLRASREALCRALRQH